MLNGYLESLDNEQLGRVLTGRLKVFLRRDNNGANCVIGHAENVGNVVDLVHLIGDGGWRGRPSLRYIIERPGNVGMRFDDMVRQYGLARTGVLVRDRCLRILARREQGQHPEPSPRNLTETPVYAF